MQNYSELDGFEARSACNYGESDTWTPNNGFDNDDDKGYDKDLLPRLE